MRYQNRYRVPSARLPEHDYASSGQYFVTCCTHGRLPLFGEQTEAAGVRLSRLGHAVASVWHRIPVVYPDVSLVSLVVMPDHLHALVELHGAGPSVSTVVQQSKRCSTLEARALGVEGPLWQTRFYDRIVRSEREATHVERYIARNPFHHP